ncbi:MAG: hypothetical protein ACLP1X_22625 [Polyangiaceae bacterium]
MMRFGEHLFGAFALMTLVAMTAASGCGQTQNSTFPADLVGGDASTGNDDGGEGGLILFPMASSGGISLGDTGAPAPACDAAVGWGCKVDMNCSSPTTLSGKVFDPAGKNPLYDVVVFIPVDATKLPPITQGTHTCNTCDDPIGNYVAATTTAYDGSFTLTGVPTASGVPVTVQIGKWRRTIGVNITNDCGTNSVSMTPTSTPLLRLPGKQSEGDMPQMALLTGGCDDMACFLMNLGIASTEFTAPHAGGRIDVYQGNSMPLGIGGPGPTLSNGTAGNCTTTSCPLWASKASFEAYDLALFSCECSEGSGNNGNETPAAYTNLRAWLNEGGKVFASHYHYTWFEDNPSADFKGVANWGNTGNNDIASTSASSYDVDDTFSKSVTFGRWLGVVGALAGNGAPPTMINTGTPASIDLNFVADSVKTVNPPTSRWIYNPANGGGEGGTTNDVKYLSFDTPIGGAAPPPEAGAESGPYYCGKAVYTDLHTGGSLLATAASVPADCKAADLSAQQKALEFLFFDLAACVTDDTKPPPPPPPNPPQ